MGTTTMMEQILNLTYCITKRNGKKLRQLIVEVSCHKPKQVCCSHKNFFFYEFDMRQKKMSELPEIIKNF